MGFKRSVSIILLIGLFFSSKNAIASFENVINFFGFFYEAPQDIYVTKVDAWQRRFGYHKIFDFFAPLGNMIIDAEPIIFAYGHHFYLIELWKGQYFTSTGAEIGIYVWNGLAWDAINDDDMVTMSYSLKRQGEVLFYLEARHWWLAGFKPGIFSHLEDLVMDDITINFKTVAMRDAFLGELYAIGYSDVHDRIAAPKEKSVITFTFDKPKNRQPMPPHSQQYFQKQNRRATCAYNKRKMIIGRNDNSPGTIEKILQSIEKYPRCY